MAAEGIIALLTSSDKYLQEFLDNLARPNGIEAQFTYRRRYFDANGLKRLMVGQPITALIVFVHAPERDEAHPELKASDCRFIPVRWVSALRFDKDFEPDGDDPEQVVGLLGTLGPLVRATEQDIAMLGEHLYKRWRDGAYAPLVQIAIRSTTEHARRAWRDLAPILGGTRLLGKCLLFHVEHLRGAQTHEDGNPGEPAELMLAHGFLLKANTTYELSLLSYKPEKADVAEIHLNPVGGSLSVSQPIHRAIGQYKQESILLEVAKLWDPKLTNLLIGRDRSKPSSLLIAHIGLAIHIKPQASDLVIGGVTAGAILAAIGQSAGWPWLTGIGTFMTGMVMWYNFRTFK